MTQQLDLFADPAPVVVGHAQARKSDPETSRIAAAEHEASGKAESNRAMIFASVQRHEFNELTFHETGDDVRAVEGLTKDQLTDNEVMRRLNDLAKAGLIQKGVARVCRVQGTKCSTWHLC